VIVLKLCESCHTAQNFVYKPLPPHSEIFHTKFVDLMFCHLPVVNFHVFVFLSSTMEHHRHISEIVVYVKYF